LCREIVFVAAVEEFELPLPRQELAEERRVPQRELLELVFEEVRELVEGSELRELAQPEEERFEAHLEEYYQR